MPCEIGAGYIEAFANSNLKDPYSWDDFESVEHSNPEVKLALYLCWWACNRHVARHDNEYMAPSGAAVFLKIASLLRSGELKEFINLTKDDVLTGKMPTSLLVRLEG